MEELPAEISVRFSIIEHDHYLFAYYDIGLEDYCLIYDIDKDICLLAKNDKPADLKALSDLETLHYKAVLKAVIKLHHKMEQDLTH